MPRPNLIHPIPITLQASDTSKTMYDDDYREAVQQVARKDDVIVPGQIKWFSDDDAKQTRGGQQLDADGYVLFRFFDLGNAGVKLKVNDRFSKFGNQDVDVYIVALTPMAHWPDQGGASLVKANFKDRTPARQNRGNL